MAKSNEWEHNCKVAEVPFKEFLKNIRKPLAEWLQYRGFEAEGSQLYFLFKSSQNSLSFRVYAGVYKGERHAGEIRAYNGEIYDYFREVKYANLND